MNLLLFFKSISMTNYTSARARVQGIMDPGSNDGRALCAPVTSLNPRERLKRKN